MTTYDAPDPSFKPRRNLRRIPCRTCGAPPGFPCVTAEGYRTEYHLSRNRAYDALGDAARHLPDVVPADPGDLPPWK